MTRPSIDYLNARRASLRANGGTNYRASETAKYAPESIRRLACTKCGAEANASCNCGVAYDIVEITARSDSNKQQLDEIREKARIKKQKQRSRPGTPMDRETLEAIARGEAGDACLMRMAEVGANEAAERAEARCAAQYKAFTAQEERNAVPIADEIVLTDDMPTEAEADESYQETLYEQACLLLDSMADATRQRFFTYLNNKYPRTERPSA